MGIADFRLRSRYLIAAFICIGLVFALIYTIRPGPTNNHQGATDQNRQIEAEIIHLIEQSNALFQAAEKHLEDQEYPVARRTFNQAIKVIAEADIDISRYPRLKKHFQELNDRIVRRQIVVSQSAFSNRLERLVEPPDGEAGSDGLSPLDALMTEWLKKERKKAANLVKAKTAIAAADLDFNVVPDAGIQSFIDYYQHRGRAAMQTGLRRSGRYMLLARRIFTQEGIPQDLVWMAQVESAWFPRALSRASAAGLWQFIPTTGKRYGLRQNDWIDERMSLERATQASARYLRWLGNHYRGNWALALAGYNAGENAVDRAITKARSRDFWKICELGLLPRETRNYVPNILATIVIAKHPERYGFHVRPEGALSFEKVMAKNPVSLRLVADAIDDTYESLAALNPELRCGITPPGMAYALRIPKGKGSALKSALRHIPPDRLATWRMITARENDTFAAIARHTKVSEKLLATVNNGVLKPGKKVIIPLNDPQVNAPAARGSWPNHSPDS